MSAAAVLAGFASLPTNGATSTGVLADATNAYNVAVAMSDGSHGMLAYFVDRSLVVAKVTAPGSVSRLAAEQVAGVTAAYRMIAVNPQGAAVAVWARQETYLTAAVTVSYRPVNGTWSSPVVLADHANSPAVKAVINNTGEAAVVWSEGGDKVAASITAAVTGDGSNWTKTPRIPLSEWVTPPSLAFNADSSAIFFGGMTRFRQVTIAAAKVSDGTSLGVMRLDANGCNFGNTNEVGLAALPDGRMLTTWCRAAGNSASIVTADLSLSNSAVTASPAKILGTMSPRSGYDVHNISLTAADAAGGSYITWQDVFGHTLWVATRANQGWTVRHFSLSQGSRPFSNVLAASQEGGTLGLELTPNPNLLTKTVAIKVATLPIRQTGALPTPTVLATTSVPRWFTPALWPKVAALAIQDGKALVIRAVPASTSGTRKGIVGTHGWSLIPAFIEG